MKYLTRVQWGATYDVTGRAMMKGLPVELVFVHHTVTEPSTDPSADMRKVEQIDIARFGVPSYSWVIHPDGSILEGMGLHRGAHTMTNGHVSLNDVSFGISHIGNYETRKPTELQLYAMRELLDTLEAHGSLRAGYAVYPHRAVFATACPGRNLLDHLSGEYPPPERTEPLDMIPAQAFDATGRHWWFVVGDDLDVWAACDGGGFSYVVPRPDGKPGTAFTSGLSALLEPSGMIAIAGRGIDGLGYQIVFDPAGKTEPWVGRIDDHPHHIWPPA